MLECRRFRVELCIRVRTVQNAWVREWVWQLKLYHLTLVPVLFSVTGLGRLRLLLVNNTNLHSASHCSKDISEHLWLLTAGGGRLNALVRGEPQIQDCKIWPRYTRDIVLWYDVQHIWHVEPRFTNVADRWTDIHFVENPTLNYAAPLRAPKHHFTYFSNAYGWQHYIDLRFFREIVRFVFLF